MELRALALELLLIADPVAKGLILTSAKADFCTGGDIDQMSKWASAQEAFDATMAMKTSKKGKYLSVTCVIRATSREQLDALYQELCDHPMVVMVL